MWEYFNEAVQRWFQCRDEAILWPDGRWVRIQIATDISARKEMEEELHKARRYAEYLADTDTLTSLNNRRAFFRQGDLALKQACRFSQPVSLIMFDLDHFKQINDQWGHTAGDQILKQVAAIASRTVRESDVVARIGGEEFAIILPQTPPDSALVLAQRLRSTIEATTTAWDGSLISCTTSIGIASTVGCSTTSLSILISKTDSALYDAKNSGRNCIVCAPTDPNEKSRIV